MKNILDRHWVCISAKKYWYNSACSKDPEIELLLDLRKQKEKLKKLSKYL